MDKDFKSRAAFEVLMILGILILLCFLTRLWPLLFLVIPGIPIAALRFLFLSANRQTDTARPVVVPTERPRPDTEQDVIRIAFGILQRRITEQVASRCPAAVWVWDAPNAVELFADGLPLTIILNRAGGFGRAAVRVHCLQFHGLAYETAEPNASDEPPPDTDANEDMGLGDAHEPDGTVDYALIAFQWAEANLIALNSRCNDIIAEGKTSFWIRADELPHPAGWPDVGEELKRNGFAEVILSDNGILVTLPK
jgi:hypothetical protein